MGTAVYVPVIIATLVAVRLSATTVITFCGTGVNVATTTGRVGSAGGVAGGWLILTISAGALPLV